MSHNNVHSVDYAWDVAQDGQQHVDEQVLSVGGEGLQGLRGLLVALARAPQQPSANCHFAARHLAGSLLAAPARTLSHASFSRNTPSGCVDRNREHL